MLTAVILVAAALCLAGIIALATRSNRVPHVPAQRQDVAPTSHRPTRTGPHQVADLPGLGSESATARLGAVRPRGYAPPSVDTGRIASASRAGAISRHPSASPRPARQLRAGRTTDDVPYMNDPAMGGLAGLAFTESLPYSGWSSDTSTQAPTPSSDSSSSSSTYSAPSYGSGDSGSSGSSGGSYGGDAGGGYTG